VALLYFAGTSVKIAHLKGAGRASLTQNQLTNFFKMTVSNKTSLI